jgi:hypothetical protein
MGFWDAAKKVAEKMQEQTGPYRSQIMDASSGVSDDKLEELAKKGDRRAEFILKERGLR